MNKKSYYQLLKDPRWQKKRLEILQRDDFSCQMCGSPDFTLHIHHISYNNGDPWEINDNALITLCEDCHEHETEEIKDNVHDLIKILKDSGMMSVDFKSLCYAFMNCNRDWRYPPSSFILNKLITDQKYWDMAEKEYFEEIKQKNNGKEIF